MEIKEIIKYLMPLLNNKLVASIFLAVFTNALLILLALRRRSTRNMTEYIMKEVGMDEWHIDLHSHTTASDGELTPTELIKLAVKKGLKAIAITDHDTLAGLEEAAKAAENEEIELIAGVEVSCKPRNPKGDAHILGLFIDREDKEFSEFLKREREKRDTRNRKMLSNLNAALPKLRATMADLEKNRKDADESIGRPHIAKLLIERGYVSTVNEAFQKYLNNESPIYVAKDDPKPAIAIEYIHNAGGIAILAHPQLCKLKKRELRDYIWQLKSIGLDGIEVLHTSLEGETKALALEVAREADLLCSGGSDFHGKAKPNTFLGEVKGGATIPYSFLYKMKQFRSREE